MSIELHTTTWGDGPRRALLLHGLSSNAAGWWRLGPDVAAHGYEVTAPDQRGHGTSPRSDDYSYAAFAEDALALAPDWDLVLGHSLGGGVAITAASLRPDWARTLILEDPALRAGEVSEIRQWLLEPYEGETSPERIASEQPRWSPEDWATKAEAIRQSSPEVAIGFLEQNLAADLTSDVAGLAVPTLLLGADPAEGALVTTAMGEALAAASANVEYVAVPGSGHSIHRDSYPAFWQAIGAYL